MKKLVVFLFAMILVFFNIDFPVAEDWRGKYSNVTLGLFTLNKEEIDRSKHLADYLSEQTGVNVVLHTRQDYGAMIDDLAAGKVQFVSCGPLPFATSYDRMRGGLEPLAMIVTKNNQRGYHIVVAVKGDSPFRTLDDLRGKTLAVPDPNSTASYTLPPSYLDPDSPFFGSIRVSGSHGKGLIGVVEGIYDCAVTWAYSKESNAVTELIKKEQLKEGDIKIIWWSSLVPNHCVAAISSLPEEMKYAFEKALIEFADKDPERFRQYNPNLSRYVATDYEDYRIAFEIRKNQERISHLLR